MNCFKLNLIRFQVYTAKSFYIEKGRETYDAQRLSDAANDAVKSEIKVNLLPTTTTASRLSSIFNLNKLNLLPIRNLMESSEDDDLENEIAKSDVIEIEVPLIGADYVKVRREQELKNENKLEINGDVDTTYNNSYAEINVLTTEATAPFDLSTSKDVLTFAADFQTSSNDETTYQNIVENTTQAEAQVDAEDDADTTTIGNEANESFVEIQTDRIQTVESKLTEQWRAADSPMSDGSFVSKLFTGKTRHYPKYPFNVKVVENNDDEKESCKSKSSCTQVRASRSGDHDIDPEFYVEYSDETKEPLRIFERPNALRSRNARRAADDINLFTPAPQLQPFQLFKGIKKPNFIERLESESSIERSERINKNLDGLMKLVGVWAHVDKFVSDRARTIVHQIAYISGDDDGDYAVGSKRGSDRKRTADDPFT